MKSNTVWAIHNGARSMLVTPWGCWWPIYQGDDRFDTFKNQQHIICYILQIIANILNLPSSLIFHHRKVVTNIIVTNFSLATEFITVLLNLNGRFKLSRQLRSTARFVNANKDNYVLPGMNSDIQITVRLRAK